MNYKKLTEKYAKDYFCEPMEQILKCALVLIESVKHGEFEYETYNTYNLLHILKNAVNEIDIESLI